MSEYKQKYFFVCGELKELCRAISDRVQHLYYTHHNNGEESVTIVFKNGYKKLVMVTADSLKAIALDVIKEI